MPTNDRVSVTLTPELLVKLRRRADAGLVSLSTAARQAIAQALARERAERLPDERQPEDAA